MNKWRNIVMLLIVAGSFAAMMLVAPFAQNPGYHDFADHRSWLGIPNFLDVTSNIPFLFVGLLGLRFCLKNLPATARSAWIVLFVGIGLVSIGSAWYHWHPTSGTLVWDRLPMTVGFMGLFVALLSENVREKLGKLLIPALILGAFSVFYWHYTDDLRLYIWVQAIPLLMIPFIMTMYRPAYTHRWLLAVALVLYLLAKLTETYDKRIFEFTGSVSGHTIKHLLAAAGCWAILRMLERRQPIER